MSVIDKISTYLKEERGSNTLQTEIAEFFKNNPAPLDDLIHAFAEERGMDHEMVEGYIYELLGSFFGAGRAKEKGITENDVNPDQLRMGIEVEMEHTSNPIIAKRIAMDHLSEHNNSDYYTRLKKMEKEMTQELGELESDFGDDTDNVEDF